MRKFEFKKSYEEIEIGGEIYKVSLKDDDRKKYGEHLLGFYTSIEEAKKVDANTITRDESLKLEDKIRDSTLETLDVLFGEGSGKKLYAASGEQTDELFDVIFEVAEIIQERREEKVNKYLKKKVK